MECPFEKCKLSKITELILDDTMIVLYPPSFSTDEVANIIEVLQNNSDCKILVMSDEPKIKVWRDLKNVD